MHRAADDAHGREVAVKILARIHDDSARRRFDRERRAMGILSGHPTIGIVYTSGFTANQEPYIVMEMIRGGSLADRLAREGPLPAADVVGLGATLAEALHHAHEGGVLHLDLKPENILISRFGQPKIVDFGIAALVDDESVTSTIRATPSYADPQVLDGKPGTEQSDVYGLAATLFTLLDGSPPYSGEPSGLYRVMQRVALDPVPRIERSDVSPELADLLHRAMAKDAADRPESMGEFAHLLHEVDAEPVTRSRAKRRRVDRSSVTPPAPDRQSPDQQSPAGATPRVDEDSGAVDDWPGEGERPRLPGAVDQSNPVPIVDPTPP
ncbi:MAG: serine/threonine-protein kinase, partial [Ilumatobacter sp.]|uniref:serine/threonine-protein kinase n=1 Tax=Ilumatobacter sp. TaxID=1967498 RepID=UPI003296B279